jgi:hypothetical protein
MAFTVTLPPIPVPAVTDRDLRRLLSLAEPAVMALADACGAGFALRLALGLGLKAVQSASES